MKALKTLSTNLEGQFFGLQQKFRQYEELKQKNNSLIRVTLSTAVILFFFGAICKYLLFPNVSWLFVLVAVVFTTGMFFVDRRNQIITDRRKIQNLQKYFAIDEVSSLITLLLNELENKYDMYNHIGSTLYYRLVRQFPQYTFEDYELDLAEYKREYLQRKQLLQKMLLLSSDQYYGFGHFFMIGMDGHMCHDMYKNKNINICISMVHLLCLLLLKDKMPN